MARTSATHGHGREMRAGYPEVDKGLPATTTAIIRADIVIRKPVRYAIAVKAGVRRPSEARRPMTRVGAYSSWCWRAA